MKSLPVSSKSSQGSTTVSRQLYKQRKEEGPDEIHQFVKQIPIFTKNLRSLTNHIHLAELVKANSEESSFRERWQTERSMVEGEVCYDILEELIATQHPPLQVLKLLALQSLAGGGIKSSKYDSLRRDLVQTYGYHYMFVLNNLEKAGLTAVKGWKGKDEFLKDLPGRLVDIMQQSPPLDFASSLQTKPTQSLGAFAETKVTESQLLLSSMLEGSRTWRLQRFGS
ncbi:hypothetical protein MHU86_17628 [Fragilaria crotonensis]|nr:hypothetical protein MHU86_17628 [Fragilaria crotonensis]